MGADTGQSDGSATAEQAPPPHLLRLFSIQSAELLCETPLAHLWKVETSDRPCAVLKLYKKSGMGNEAGGFDFLRATNGQSAAQLYDLTKDAALIEYLQGPSLGDLSRNGNDHEAAVQLVNVANNLHAAQPSPSGSVQTVEGWLSALFEVRYGSELTAKSQAHFNRAKRLARDLLAAPAEILFLHGDLHHDNIRACDRGYCAFDAKGVLGERAYELANAFRHPKGAEHLARDANRVCFLRDLWSAEFSVSSHRLMQWVCVKTALSICWRSHSDLGQDQEFDLLEIFLGILDETA